MRRLMAGNVGRMSFRPDHRPPSLTRSNQEARQMTKFTIVIPLYPNVTHLDFTGPHQVLGRAPDTEIVVASLGGVDMTCDGLTFTGLADLAKVEHCDMICVPGGLGTAEAMLDEAFVREVH